MEIFRYTRISDIEDRLAMLGNSKEPEKEVYFLVPARPDMQMLKDILAEKTSFGRQKWRIWRWTDLYREIWTENRSLLKSIQQRRQIDPPDHWIIVRYILKNFIESEEKDPDRELPPGIRTGGFISTLGSTLRELLREEVSPEDLAEALDCSGCPKDGPCPNLHLPEGLLCRLYTLYSSYLEKGGTEGLFDSAQIATLTREALEITRKKNPDWTRNKHLVFTGFSSFNHSQKKLVEALENFGSEITVFSPRNGTPGSYTVRDQFPEASVSDLPHLPVRSIEIAGGDRRIEVETIARELIMWSERCGELYCKNGQKDFPGWENTGMTVPEELLSTAEEVLERYNIPYNVRHGLTAAMTPLWETLRRIRDCLYDDWPGRETLRLLGDPLFAGEDANLLDTGPVLPAGRQEWHRTLGTADSGLREVFEAITGFTDSLYSGSSPSGLLELVAELADKCEWDRKLSSFIIDDPDLDERCRQFNAALREAREKVVSVGQLQKDIGTAGEKLLKGQEAFTYLANWARETTIWHRPGNTGSLDVFAGTPPVFASKDVWIFCGASSNSWPGNIRESALLPDARKDLLHSSLALGNSHLPLLSEQRRQREMLFNRICACGKDLTIISYPLTDTSGRPQAPSVFIKRGLDEKGKTPWMTPACEDNLVHRGPGQILPGTDEIQVGTSEVPERTFYPQLIKERELPLQRSESPAIDSVSISDIDTWAACPFRFYCMRILKLEEAGPVLYDAARAGMVLHELWRRVWIEKKDGESIAAKGYALFEEVASEIYPELLAEPSLGRFRSRLKIQVSKGGFAQEKMEATGLRDPKIPPLFEGRLPSLELKGIHFRGRFDRLDTLTNGTGIICDYKSGKSETFKKSLQLPAYSLLYEKGENFGGMPEEISGFCYICHSDGKLYGLGDTPEAEGYVFASRRGTRGTTKAREKAEETMEAMAESISKGIFAPDYNSDACRYCQYSGICRKYESAPSAGNGME